MAHIHLWFKTHVEKKQVLCVTHVYIMPHMLTWSVRARDLYWGRGCNLAKFTVKRSKYEIEKKKCTTFRIWVLVWRPIQSQEIFGFHTPPLTMTPFSSYTHVLHQKSGLVVDTPSPCRWRISAIFDTPPVDDAFALSTTRGGRYIIHKDICIYMRVCVYTF